MTVKYHQREFYQLNARHKAMPHKSFILYVRNAQKDGVLNIPARADQLIEEHRIYKSQRAPVASGKAKARDAWGRRIHVLHDELRSVRSGIRYQQTTPNPNPALADALDAYLKVLEKCLKRMNAAKTWGTSEGKPYGVTVRDLNMMMPSSTHITNSGEHWFDFVPPHARMTILAAFEAALTHKSKKGRWRTPFTRTEPSRWTKERFSPGGKPNVPTLQGEDEEDDLE